MFIDKLFGKKTPPHLAEMNALLLQLKKSISGGGDMDIWVPQIRKRLYRGDIAGLVKARSEEFEAGGFVCTGKAHVQAVVALGALGTDEAAKALRQLAGGNASFYKDCVDLRQVAAAVLQVLRL
jgi:hypothetical protein